MLSWRERFRVTWELVWPGTLIDATRALLLFLLGIESTSLDSIYLLIAFFVVEPWVVRRALRLKYPGLHFNITGEEDSEPRPMSYQESLKVVWLLTWRSTLLLLAAAVPFSFLVGKVLHLPLTEWFHASSRLANALGLTMVDLVTGLAFFPLLIPAMLRKEYRGFRIAAIRPARTSAKVRAGKR